MIKTAQYIDKEKAAEIESKIGGYNDMPPNVSMIKESEFLWLFGQKHANGYQDFRQVKLPTVTYDGKRENIGAIETFCHVYLWINTDLSGVGMIRHYNGVATRSRVDAFFSQYFRFHYCKHDFETLEQSMSWWKGKCRKCGYVEAIDSSG